MFGTPAFAQTAAPAAAAASGPLGFLENAGPFPMVIGMFLLFYFLLIRPQQKRAKEHQEMIKALKRGDTVVLSSGVIGKVTRVDETELGIEIAPTVTIKVVRSMVTEVRSRSEPAPANDKTA
jgi:preprotein translocase subunit YajC